MEDARSRVESLRALIRRHEYHYYVEGESRIPDSEFDRLMAELRALEEQHPELVTADSPTRRVGGVAGSFETVQHRVPMISLDNAYSSGDLADWITRMQKLVGERVFPIVAELKIDGVSASVTFQNGRYIAAATRGDGEVGDLVTGNVRTIRALPLVIESGFDMDLRGEVYLPKSRLAAINHARLEAGEEPFKNCRNLAAGTLKSLDPSVPAERGLQLLVYGIAQARDLGFKRHSEVLDFLAGQGFAVNRPFKVCTTLAEIEDWLAEIARMRDTLDFDIDGVVLKVDDLATQVELGSTTKSPRWAVAYKFAQEQAKTRLEAVVWQVGRSQITPVALLSPVQLGGTTVSRASLHNLDQIREKDIRIGDRVLVEKAGYIIPYVIGSCHEERTGEEIAIVPPPHCPSCGGPIEVAQSPEPGEAGTVVRCANGSCRGVLLRRMQHFITHLEIENIGVKLVERLVQTGLVSEITDFFRLRREDLLSVERMGEKSADKILANLEKARKAPLARLIAALGIPNVGIVAAEDVARHVGTFEGLRTVTGERLQQVDGVGEKVAGAIIAYLADPGSVTILDELARQWHGPTAGAGETVAQTLVGKTFVITGEASVPRRDLEELVKAHGGRVSSSVSPKTGYLVIGSLEPPDFSSSKKTRALSLNIPIIDEFTLKKLAVGGLLSD